MRWFRPNSRRRRLNVRRSTNMRHRLSRTGKRTRRHALALRTSWRRPGKAAVSTLSIGFPPGFAAHPTNTVYGDTLLQNIEDLSIGMACKAGHYCTLLVRADRTQYAPAFDPNPIAQRRQAGCVQIDTPSLRHPRGTCLALATAKPQRWTHRQLSSGRRQLRERPHPSSPRNPSQPRAWHSLDTRYDHPSGRLF